jgi:hypothetical protein
MVFTLHALSLILCGLTGIILHLSGEGHLKIYSRLYGSVGWVN